MNRMNQWIALGLMLATPLLSGCGQTSAAPAEHASPAVVDHIDGSEISRVTLSEDAMERLDVQTAAVTEEQSPRSDAVQKVVPYSALIYDPKGDTWVYTSPQPRVFVREQMEVDFIQGGMVYLTSGPATGTKVATVGVPELYGTEFTVGH